VPWTTNNTFCATGSNALFHTNANDTTSTNRTRFERVSSPNITVPLSAQYVTIDFDACYDVEDDPNFNILAYDGFDLRITDFTAGHLARANFAEALAESFSTGASLHYPKHNVRSSNTNYFQDVSLWSGFSNGFTHVSMRFNGMAGDTVQLRPDYTQDSFGICSDVRPGHTCGVMMDNIVVRAVISESQTALAFTAASATTSDYHDAATVQARLGTALGIPGKTITFVLGSGAGSPTCSALTDSSGIATCSLTPNQAAGPYTLHADFAGDAMFLPASATTNFTVTKEETVTKFTSGSPTVTPVGNPVTLSATLKEDGVTGISGRIVIITLGTGVAAQSCSGTTDAAGLATCTIAVVNQALGPNTVAASFAGDTFYLPSSDSEAITVFAFLSKGSMVIGDMNAGVGSSIEFWGAQWAKKNSLSGGPAPDSFKGFADAAPQACGGNWSSGPGDSSDPPATVPSYMGVIASSSTTQSGDALSGNVPMIVVVKTDRGYGPSPGREGTGTVVAKFCP
jgi:hypothetical protein